MNHFIYTYGDGGLGVESARGRESRESARGQWKKQESWRIERRRKGVVKEERKDRGEREEAKEEENQNKYTYQAPIGHL